jgi:hypothetical protein
MDPYIVTSIQRKSKGRFMDILEQILLNDMGMSLRWFRKKHQVKIALFLHLFLKYNSATLPHELAIDSSLILQS